MSLRRMWAKQQREGTQSYEKELENKQANSKPMKLFVRVVYRQWTGKIPVKDSSDDAPVRYNPRDPRTFHLKDEFDDDNTVNSSNFLNQFDEKKDGTNVRLQSLKAALYTVYEAIKRDIKK